MSPKKPNPFKFVAVAATSLLIGTFLSPILTCGDSQPQNPLQLKADSNDKASPAQVQAVALEDAFREVFEKASPSVVLIQTEQTLSRSITGDPYVDHFFGLQNQGRSRSGLGSGIILNEEGYVLTNHHVIGGMDKFTVRLKNKKKFEAVVIGSDSVLDIALLKIDAPKEELKAASIGDSEKVKVGNWAIAIGAPLGLDYSFTVGVISAVERAIDNSGLSYIQTDAAINQGNSGGPLLNIKGEVIGINRMIFSQSGGSEGIGLTIPINEAKKVAEQLKLHGKVNRPWIGISMVAVTEEINEDKRLGLTSLKGALIAQILANSPAHKAGLRPLDFIIELDGKPVSGPDDVKSIISSSKVGKGIQIKIIRNRKEILTSITPMQIPK
ncbi:S1C family serine protease [Leptospira idonii]|uniref:PDZ domain-containing protein n=1 Tax=Leptospira idonii TaxID=1193500 RepID=A0A4R9LYP9_9LEPT|nr:trypsin-like peptidase domain-containing protein [Leptospira idonii]TGN19463.1 PDZ domain-containing protein [Leptospira idonii]